MTTATTEAASAEPRPAGVWSAIGLIGLLIVLSGWVYSAAYIAYLGFPATQFARFGDYVRLATSALPLMVVALTIAGGAHLALAKREPNEEAPIAPSIALGVGVVVIALALWFLWSPPNTLDRSWWLVIGAPVVGLALALAFEHARPALADGFSNRRIGGAIAIFVVAFFLIGWGKAYSDYWRVPQWRVPAAESSGDGNAVVFMQRHGVCLVRREGDREPSFADRCWQAEITRGAGRACFAIAPNVPQPAGGLLAGECTRRLP